MSDPSFRVLGPLQVVTNGSALRLGGHKPRAVLGTLLLNANHPVATELLVDVLWTGAPPRSAVANVRTYLSVLRARLPDSIDLRITAAGYVAELAPQTLDVAEFERLAHSDERAELDAACGLWRGRVLEDLPGCPTWAPTIARLNEHRLVALERRAALRHPADAVAELRGLLVDHPLREGLWRQLMAALWRSGRAAEAMQAYAEAEQALRRELAVGPGAELRELRERIRSDTLRVTTDPPLGRTLAVRDLVELLADGVGRTRVWREPEAAEEIVRLCDELPLAVRAVADRLAARPHQSLRAYADRLRDERRRLDELRPVRTKLRQSAERLPAAAQRALWVLSLFGPVRLPAWQIDAGAEALVRAGLLEAVGEGRFRLPDLVRCFGAEQARKQPAAERSAAVAAVVGRWVALADQARRRMPVHFLGVTPTVGPTRGAPQANVVGLDPMAWFEVELPALVSAIEAAAEAGCDGLAWKLAATLAPYFDLTGGYDAWERTHRVGLEAARRERNERGQAMLLRNLGQLDIYRDRYDAAATQLDRARTLFAHSGDERCVAIAVCGLATIRRLRGQYESAVADYDEALAAFRATRDRHGEAVVLSGLGQTWLDRGQPGRAEPLLDNAYALALELGDRHRQAQVLRRLSYLHRNRGRADEALTMLRRALALFTELADEHCAAYVRQSIGELHLGRHEPTRARPHLVVSLHAHRRSGDRRGEAAVATLLGELHNAAGRTRRARSYFSQARTLWQQLAVPDQEAAVAGRLRGLRTGRECTDRVSPVRTLLRHEDPQG